MSAIITNNLNRSFGDVKAVQDLNLDIKEGIIHGFLGANGAGKTTTLKMLTGFIKPTSGNIFILGKQLNYGDQSVFSEIGFLPDVPNFYGWMNAQEFLMFCGKLFNIDDKELLKRTEELLVLVGLHGNNAKISGYSRGMKQRLGIAQALINNPKIIMLDEPTSALDPIGRKEVMDIIKSLAGRVTVFLSSHILSDIERVCSRVTILDKGKQILEEDIGVLKESYSTQRVIVQTADRESSQKLVDIMQTVPWVVNAALNRETELNITVNNIESAQMDIPMLLYKNNIPLVKMELKQPTLEDIFVDIVKK